MVALFPLPPLLLPLSVLQKLPLRRIAPVAKMSFSMPTYSIGASSSRVEPPGALLRTAREAGGMESARQKPFDSASAPQRDESSGSRPRSTGRGCTSIDILPELALTGGVAAVGIPEAT